MKKRIVIVLFSDQNTTKRIQLPDSLITYKDIDLYVWRRFKGKNSGWGEGNFHLPEWIAENSEYIAYRE